MQPLTSGQLVWPGQPLIRTETAEAGPGTLKYGTIIYATTAGRFIEVNLEGQYQVYVEKVFDQFHGKGIPVLPSVNAIILGRVSRIRSKEATVSIFAVGETVCQRNFQGVIRLQDVRATEKDSVKIHTSFRPGDIVRAQVISLGDASSYYLSTAKDDLGVVLSINAAGQGLYPINSRQVRVEATGNIEKRKCAVFS